MRRSALCLVSQTEQKIWALLSLKGKERNGASLGRSETDKKLIYGSNNEVR
jgi:hypothetical protein